MVTREYVRFVCICAVTICILALTCYAFIYWEDKKHDIYLTDSSGNRACNRARSCSNIPVSSLLKDANTGDLIGYSATSGFQFAVIRVLTQSPWTHVGVIVEAPPEAPSELISPSAHSKNLYVVDLSRSRSGMRVQATPLQTYVAIYGPQGKRYPMVYSRFDTLSSRLSPQSSDNNSPRDPVHVGAHGNTQAATQIDRHRDVAHRILSYVQENQHVEFDLWIPDWIQTLQQKPYGSYRPGKWRWCSEVIMDILQKVNLIPKEVHPRSTYPGALISGHHSSPAHAYLSSSIIVE